MKQQRNSKDILLNNFTRFKNIDNEEYIKPSLLILHFSITLLLACNDKSRQIKFDKNKWNEQTDPLFPSSYRPQMLTDLTTNNKLTGVKYSQLVELLGIPDDNDSSSISYKILVDYGHDIDLIYIKNLNFTFSNDSVITSFKIDEWRK